jgi:hypothetical protein
MFFKAFSRLWLHQVKLAIMAVPFLPPLLPIPRNPRCRSSFPALLRIIYPLFGSFTIVRASLTQLTILANLNSTVNTPAADSWNLYLGYSPAGSFTENLIPITFLPTGEIDKSTSNQSLATANALLAPTTTAMRLLFGDPEIDIWKFMNWVVVSYYWLFLYDFGQTSPTYYDSADGDTKLTSPIFYSSANNIFVNSTLFSIYSSFLIDILSAVPGSPPLEFLPLDSNNSLQPTATVFLTSYSCLQRQLQPWLTATISVIVADYVFIAGGYSLVVTIASWWSKRRSTEGNSRSDLANLIANVCEGCLSLKKNIPLDILSTDNVEDNRDSLPLISKISQ